MLECREVFQEVNSLVVFIFWQGQAFFVGKAARIHFLFHGVNVASGFSLYANEKVVFHSKTNQLFALFGHSHGGLEGAQPEDTDCGKILDCGVDNALKYNGTPFFSFQEVVEIMNRKNIKTYDHH